MHRIINAETSCCYLCESSHTFPFLLRQKKTLTQFGSRGSYSAGKSHLMLTEKRCRYYFDLRFGVLNSKYLQC